MSRASAFDAAGMRAVAVLRRPWLNRVVVPFTTSGNYGALWVALGALVGAPVRVAATTWTTLGVNYGVKRVIRRERPVVEELETLIPLPLSTSFPSSHAAMSLAAAFALTRARPELWQLWFAAALLMALSRVYVRAHYPSDVAVGIALGALVGLAALSVG
jgi:membrane-associated phospholipid phosphatase